jgi:2-desacetyl-2-hydroxyethyl bacteriochlorophyllide A dehydrogenase
MKALVLKDRNKIEIEDLPYQERKNAISIKVKTMGICGSDISAYRGANPLVKYPLVLGHEIAGVVIRIPENEKEIKVGDRVVLEPYKYCGNCYPCKIGRNNCCENLDVIGVHVDGGMSEYYSHDPQLVHRVSASVTWPQMAMIEPLTVALQGIKRAEVSQGEHVVILGAGTIGLLVSLLVKYIDAIPILIDPLEKRLSVAEELGVPYFINPDKEDGLKRVEEITLGRKAEVVIEASGTVEAVRDTINYVSFAGRISLIGYPKGEILYPTFLITKKELDLKGSRNSLKAFPEAIKLLENGEINVDPLITDIIDFNDMPEYIKEISENPDEHLKVIGRF